MSSRGSAAANRAIDELIAATTGGIRRILRTMNVPPSERADVLQDVFFIALRAIREGRFQPDPEANPTAALRAYVYKIAVVTAWRHRERARRHPEIAAGLDPWALADEPGEDPDGRIEARSELWALRHLAREHRTILLARAEGATLKEISAVYARPIATTARHIEQARARWAAIIEEPL